MKKTVLLLLLFSSHVYGQDWVTPVIDGYGKIKYSKNIAVQPDDKLEYKIKNIRIIRFFECIFSSKSRYHLTKHKFKKNIVKSLQ